MESYAPGMPRGNAVLGGNMSTILLLRRVAEANGRRFLAALQNYRAPTYQIGVEVPVQTFYHGSKLFDPLGLRPGLSPRPGIPAGGLAPCENDLTAVRLKGRRIEFEVDPTLSFFGDCIRIVDAPGEKPLDPQFPPFGWSEPMKFGGYAITASALRGIVTLEFSEADDELISFEMQHGSGLTGADSWLAAPEGYLIASRQNLVIDVTPASRGRLDPKSGRIFDFHYNVGFSNTAIQLLGEKNPRLTPPPLLFPGLPHAGHAIGWAGTGEDGKLVLQLAAQQFIPLGPDADGEPIVFPASQAKDAKAEDFHGRNSSLHPYIFLTARQTETGTATTAGWTPAQARPAVPLANYELKTTKLVCLPSSTNFGDDFHLVSHELGGTAFAQSPLFGYVTVQFGKIVAGYMPFTLQFDALDDFGPKFRELLSILPPGTHAGLSGMAGEMRFPKSVFQQSELSLNTDPYKVSLGVVGLESGESAPFVLRKYLFQNVMRRLILIEPRTPTDSFAYVSNATFTEETGGQLKLELSGECYIPYPEGYGFPISEGGAACILAGSYLKPFVNLYAVAEDAFKPAKPDIEVRAEKKLRGKFGLDYTFSARTAPDGICTVEFGGDDFRFRSTQCTAKHAVLSDREVWTFRLQVDATSGKRVPCFAAFTEHGDGRWSLLMTSTDEACDTWLEGSR
jgi:hypothetical protein